MLLDYKLNGLGISTDRIDGYGREEYTHLAVAAAVAAVPLTLDWGSCRRQRQWSWIFVPLLTEQYDLVIPSEHYESDLLQPLLSLIRTGEFRSEVDELGGYDTSTMGEVVARLSGDGA